MLFRSPSKNGIINDICKLIKKVTGLKKRSVGGKVKKLFARYKLIGITIKVTIKELCPSAYAEND